MVKKFNSDFESLINKILELLHQERYLHFIEDLATCDDLAPVLEEYNNSLNNQEQVKLAKIKSIVSRSTFFISLDKGKYEVKLEVIKENGDREANSLSLHDLQELRDRALLSKYIIDQKSNSIDIAQDSEIYESFVKFVDKLGEYIEILNQLSQSLYRNELRVEGKIEIIKGNLSELMMFYEYHKYLLNEKWKK